MNGPASAGSIASAPGWRCPRDRSRGAPVEPALLAAGATVAVQRYRLHAVACDLPLLVIPLSGTKLLHAEGRSWTCTPFTPIGDLPHRYVFKVHALKVENLYVPEDASPALFGFMLHSNTIGSAQMTATYARPQRGTHL